ncbi:hypothetical protein H696_00412 [Fonticula alba]|uniref:MINDY deubiquitinase domain-containing protein n=1 Tax=Fonticula alba TaxID=691883 RepID=A0A058ZFV7_FONAL|nr:hypothetical protein H696_00412 [Fonticula alba]KCV72836.1 hypothetical protein H696_00412 [Fonticula alba]|eukprot:XP_009492537.1 hypothetical protein H696_00412 [Fonticula alba]
MSFEFLLSEEDREIALALERERFSSGSGSPHPLSLAIDKHLDRLSLEDFRFFGDHASSHGASDPGADGFLFSEYTLKTMVWPGCAAGRDPVEPMPIQVVSQNANGPCPMISAANALILQGRLSIPPGFNSIPATDLAKLVFDIARRFLSKKHSIPLDNNTLRSCRDSLFSGAHIQSDYVPDHFLQYLLELQAAHEAIRKSIRGLDIDLVFDHVKEFKESDARFFFEILELPLFHAWIPQSLPKNLSSGELSQEKIDHLSQIEALRGRSYNDIQNIIVSASSSEDLALKYQAKVLQNFLVASSSQMTTQGLRQVISCLLDFCSWPPWVRAAHAFQFSTTTRQVQPTRLPESPHATLHLPVGVLFWNNHFLTVVRFNKTLYSLLSDEGYANEVTVWQSVSADGAGSLRGWDFSELSDL